MRLPGLVVWKCHLHFHQIVIIRVNRPTKAAQVKASQRCSEWKPKDLQPADRKAQSEANGDGENTQLGKSNLVPGM